MRLPCVGWSWSLLGADALDVPRATRHAHARSAARGVALPHVLGVAGTRSKKGVRTALHGLRARLST